MYESLTDRRIEGRTPLEQARIVQLYILDVFDEICKKNGLRYWLDYGTLIGAMRHDGYIPWDDDIDVSMPLDDYKKFLKIAPELLPNTLLLQDLRKTPGSMFSFAKLRDRCSFYCEHETAVQSPCGIFIDIFPWVKAPNLPKSLLNCWTHFQYSTLRHAGAALARRRVSAFCKIFDCVVSLLWRGFYNVSYWAFSATRLLLPSSMWRPRQDGPATFCVPETEMFPLSTHVFEGKKYMVPRNADYRLTQEYGDWRVLPPLDKRISHATIINATMTPPHTS